MQPLPHGRFMQPVTNFAMSPTTGNKNLTEKAISRNLGPFYGKAQAEEWKKELYEKNMKDNIIKTYDTDRYPQLYTDAEKEKRDRL